MRREAKIYNSDLCVQILNSVKSIRRKWDQSKDSTKCNRMLGCAVSAKKGNEEFFWKNSDHRENEEGHLKNLSGMTEHLRESAILKGGN